MLLVETILQRLPAWLKPSELTRGSRQLEGGGLFDLTLPVWPAAEFVLAKNLGRVWDESAGQVRSHQINNRFR